MITQERKIMMELADAIKGEINRMCVTKDLHELDMMANYAILHIKKLQVMKFAELDQEYLHI